MVVLVLVASVKLSDNAATVSRLSFFFLKQINIKQGSFRPAMTSLAWDVEVALFRISRETAREISSNSTLVWYMVDIAVVERGAAAK